MNFTGAAGPREIEAWFTMLREIDASSPADPCGALLARMAAAGLAGIEVERPGSRPRRRQASNEDAKERAKGIYAQTIEVISDVMDHVKLGKALRLKRAKRVVQSMIDQLLAAETNLLGLTNLRCYDEYTYNHSVNVGILSIAIGQRVGIGKNRLVDLGMAAVFHDIGKSCIPLAVLNKPGPFDEREWAVIRRHPVLGVKELLKLKGVDALTARIMQGAFEHHLNLDGSGYPRVDYPRGVSLSGRIVAIADCYDALTSARVYRRTAETPDATLRYILQKSGTLYDPILAKLFVNVLGVYPAGTLCPALERGARGGHAEQPGSGAVGAPLGEGHRHRRRRRGGRRRDRPTPSRAADRADARRAPPGLDVRATSCDAGSEALARPALPCERDGRGTSRPRAFTALPGRA